MTQLPSFEVWIADPTDLTYGEWLVAKHEERERMEAQTRALQNMPPEALRQHQIQMAEHAAQMRFAPIPRYSSSLFGGLFG